jgi:phosphatidate cytidylyltransferase
MHPFLLIYPVMTALGLTGSAIIIARSGSWKHPLVLKSISYIFIVGICITTFLPGWFHITALVIVVGGMAEMILLTARPEKRNLNLLSTLLYTGISMGFVLFTLRAEQDLLALLLLIVFTLDAFSQLTGQLFGKRRIFPRISPNKTLGGTLGGAAVTILLVIIVHSSLNFTLLASIVLSIQVIVAASAGDLLASLLKRKNGIKDYSSWLPGQGGFLDRFDSLIFAGFYLYCTNFIISL